MSKQGTKLLPKGTYKTTLNASQLTGPFKGQGQIIDAANNKHAPNMALVNMAPATYLRIKIDGTVYKVPCYNN